MIKVFSFMDKSIPISTSNSTSKSTSVSASMSASLSTLISIWGHLRTSKFNFDESAIHPWWVSDESHFRFVSPLHQIMFYKKTFFNQTHHCGVPW
jgi:hypothetical protein